jgi:UDP-glucose-4-epimerase GalE
MHFAALSLVGESVARPDLYHRVNITASLNLFDAMRAQDVAPVVFSSTCAIYGDAPEGEDLTEDCPMAPKSPYGASKLAVERILSDYETAFGLRGAALRYFNVAGADPEGEVGERHEPETHLIPIAIEAALGVREKLSVFGRDYPTPDGACVRDYVHVMDLAAAHVLALEALLEGETGLRLNLGAGRGHSVLEVADCVARVSGRPVPLEDAPRRAGDPPRLVADHTRATKALGWRPERSDLDTIVADALRWRASPRFDARG